MALHAAWGWVLGAIVAETVAALALRASDGFTRPLPALFATASFACAFYLTSLALVELPVSLVYPVWAGGGTAGAATAALWLYGERAGVRRMLGVAAVVAGIVVLNFASPA